MSHNVKPNYDAYLIFEVNMNETAELKYLKKVGRKIREHRIKSGLTQEDVENFGVSWKHYQKIEGGHTNTTIKILYLLSKAFKCNPKDFLP